MSKYKKLIIGIDQSYKNTGISVTADGKLKKVSSLFLDICDNNSERRVKLTKHLNKIVSKLYSQADEIVCIVERIRLQSQGFINIDYIKSIGALNASIVDVMSPYGIPVYSVDTRCWKSQIVGTSKPGPENNIYNMDPKKYPTFEWLKTNHFEFVPSVLIDVSQSRKKKNIFEENGKKWKINDDACDSAAISMFGFYGDKSKLKLES